MTFKCPKFLPLIHFLSFIFNIASAYLQLTNLTITLLSCSHDIYLGIPWERGSQWQPSMSLASTSIPDSLQMLITQYSPNLHCRYWLACLITPHYSFGYTAPLLPDIFLAKFIVLSSNLLLTFFVITSSLVSFLFSNKIWSIASDQIVYASQYINNNFPFQI